jgi:hypothetical protein
LQFLRGQDVWVRRVEHMVLRVVSLAFSLASAHAIRWFFAPLDGIDALQPLITWMIAGGFGILGYIVSRGLAHRLMNKERIRAYAPICAVVEVVEIFCNYALAAAVIQRATWLQVIPSQQRALLTGLTYVVLSIIPLVSLMLAVVDMDLERSKLRGAGPVGGGIGVGSPVLHGSRGPAYAPPPVMQPFRAQAQPQPKEAGYANGSVMGAPGFPAYAEGYAGAVPGMVPGVAPVASPQAQQAGGVPKQGGLLSTLPFLGKQQAPVSVPTTVLPSTQ